MDEDEPISYLALAVGTDVCSATGRVVGTVAHVLQIPSEDLFDGIVVRIGHELRFVDRDQISSITRHRVICALSDDEFAALPPPEGTPELHVDPQHDVGPSLTARLGRMFRR
jgi:hypothetical protein